MPPQASSCLPPPLLVSNSIIKWISKPRNRNPKTLCPFSFYESWEPSSIKAIVRAFLCVISSPIQVRFCLCFFVVSWWISICLKPYVFPDYLNEFQTSSAFPNSFWRATTVRTPLFVYSPSLGKILR